MKHKIYQHIIDRWVEAVEMLKSQDLRILKMEMTSRVEGGCLNIGVF